MNIRILLPMIGGIIALLIARRNELDVLATFGVMFAGMFVGWGINTLIRRLMS